MRRTAFRQTMNGSAWGLDAEYGLNALDAIGGSLADALYQWVREGRIGGGFFTALVENKLTETFNRADSVNVHKIGAAVQWLYNFAPCECQGSPIKVNRWIAAHDVRTATRDGFDWSGYLDSIYTGTWVDANELRIVEDDE